MADYSLNQFGEPKRVGFIGQYRYATTARVMERLASMYRGWVWMVDEWASGFGAQVAACAEAHQTDCWDTTKLVEQTGGVVKDRELVMAYLIDTCDEVVVCVPDDFLAKHLASEADKRRTPITFVAYERVNENNQGATRKEESVNVPQVVGTEKAEIWQNNVGRELEDGIQGYAIIDFETGGFDPVRDALLSVGIVTLDRELNETSQFYTLIQDEPGRTVKEDALAVNGIALKEVAERGMAVCDVLAEIENVLMTHIPVCHNTAFDLDWLRKRGFNLAKAIDTMHLSYQWFPYQKAKLAMVAERLGVTVKDAHNALGDCLMTAEVLRRFARQFPGVLLPKPIDWDFWTRQKR